MRFAILARYEKQICLSTPVSFAIDLEHVREDVLLPWKQLELAFFEKLFDLGDPGLTFYGSVAQARLS